MKASVVPTSPFTLAVSTAHNAHLPFQTIAWMGGSHPTATQRKRPVFQGIALFFFREQVRTWEAYWNERCPLEQRRIFAKRASGDAWATVRDTLFA